MKMNPVPNKNAEHVKKFCRSIAPNQKPLYVAHEPMLGAKAKECFTVVPKKIAAQGGKQVFGWAIFEIKKIWLEAEFHVVWQREDGTLIDLTPREHPTSRILFVPDPTREYEGIQVMPIFKALSKRAEVQRFIEVQAEFFRETNKGDLAYQRDIPTTPRLRAIQDEMKQLQHKIFS